MHRLRRGYGNIAKLEDSDSDDHVGRRSRDPSSFVIEFGVEALGVAIRSQLWLTCSVASHNKGPDFMRPTSGTLPSLTCIHVYDAY